MTHFEVLVEGSSDVPVITEIFERRFGLTRGTDFNVHPHQGKGKIPSDLSHRPDPKNRQLLHQLPAKLRAYGRTLSESVVLVVVDADNDDPETLREQLNRMLAALPKPLPKVRFELAIEEIESWFIADLPAVQKAYPKAKTAALKRIQPDQIVGAWEKLGEAVEGKGVKNKTQWATKISPHLELVNPFSPSLQRLIEGIAEELKTDTAVV
jgi:hypothetical protein